MRLVPAEYARGPTHRICHGIRLLWGCVEVLKGVRFSEKCLCGFDLGCRFLPLPQGEAYPLL